jgi:hypothetical protein
MNLDDPRLITKNPKISKVTLLLAMVIVAMMDLDEEELAELAALSDARADELRASPGEGDKNAAPFYDTLRDNALYVLNRERTVN